MRSIEKIEIVSDNYKLVSQHRIGGLQVDGYFKGASVARYDLQPPVIVLAILGFTNLRFQGCQNYQEAEQQTQTQSAFQI